MLGFKHSVKFILQQTKDKSKPTPLRCWVRFNGQRSVFKTGILVEPRYWNGKTQEPRQTIAFTQGALVAKQLKSIKTWVTAEFERITSEIHQYPDTEHFKEICIAILNRGGEAAASADNDLTYDLISYFEKLIADTKTGKRVKRDGSRYATDSVKSYKSTMEALKRFLIYTGRKALPFNDIDLDFYQDIKDYAFEVENYADNSFGSLIRCIKATMNEAQEAGLHNNLRHRSSRFVKVQVEVENIYLNFQQLDALLLLDLSKNPRLDRVRDLFLVGCWTGLRFSDFTNIQASNIHNGFIDIKTQKTGESVAIPIHDTIARIMKKYAGKTSNSLPPGMSNVKLNSYIKEVAASAGEKFPDSGLLNEVSLQKSKAGIKHYLKKPTYELITTHTARRTFASNMFKMGVPSIVVMAVTGHRTEKAFMKYIKVTPKEKAEMLREIWNRQSMQAV
ncbi:site-specific integrase [Mucilaginibacter koreensis]